MVLLPGFLSDEIGHGDGGGGMHAGAVGCGGAGGVGSRVGGWQLLWSILALAEASWCLMWVPMMIVTAFGRERHCPEDCFEASRVVVIIVLCRVLTP
jgi:hypothetical protein